MNIYVSRTQLKPLTGSHAGFFDLISGQWKGWRPAGSAGIEAGKDRLRRPGQNRLKAGTDLFFLFQKVSDAGQERVDVFFRVVVMDGGADAAHAGGAP